ncbi:MAG: neutral zinc metallopeptidase [Verrucomicrobiota bacterium]
MRWKGRRQSTNVEDRRHKRGKPLALGGGLGTIVIIVLIILLGGDPQALLEQVGTSTQYQQQSTTPASAADEELAQFVSTVLADTEDVWNNLFRRAGQNYQEPTLVLFSDRVRSACGIAGSQTGPFYCPADGQVYIDLSFYRDLRDRLGAPGDFAQAYVIAHEVGHHVQNLLGISGQVHQMRSRLSQSEYNQLSVRLELQADYFAGVWAHHAQRMKNILEQGDIQEAMNAANAIGDDRLQKQAQGYVVPDSFTHGTSEQRMRWFLKGFQSGDMSGGDTFSARQL